MHALASSIEQWPSDPFWIFLLHRKSFNYIARNTEVQAKDYKRILPLNKLEITKMPLEKGGKYARDWTLTSKTV